MVSQSGSDPRGQEDAGMITPEGRRGSFDEGDPTAGDLELQRILETGWAQRGARTGFRHRILGDEDADDAVEDQQGRGPIEESADAVRETEEARGVAGFDMSGMRDAIRTLMQEELRKMAGEGDQGIGSGAARVPNRASTDALRGGRGEDTRGPFYFASAPGARTGASTNPQMTTGGVFSTTATMGDSKFTVAMPPRFDPSSTTWMLWKPQVLSYFEMIGLKGILDKVDGHKHTLQTNRYVIGALQQISPPTDASWMSALHLKFAYEAWAQLEKSYGARAELEMQRKLFEFETASQRESETVREWIIRLERQVLELNVMAKEAAREHLLGYDQQRDTAVYESSHKLKLLNVRVESQVHEVFVASMRTSIYSMSVKDVEDALITYEQGRQVQHALNSAGSAPVYNTQVATTGRAAPCYACDGLGHHWRHCPTARTQAGRAKLIAKGIAVPQHFGSGGERGMRGASASSIQPSNRRGYGNGGGRGRGGRGYPNRGYTGRGPPGGNLQ